MSSHPAAFLSKAPDAHQLSFIIGQDQQGHWIAVETHGLAGGIFRSCKDAIHYAADETRSRPDAVALSTERIEFRI
jgi:hypothetical protein